MRRSVCTASREQLPTLHSSMHLYPINGRGPVCRKPGNGLSYREAERGQLIVGVDPDPANREKITAWAKDYYDNLHRFRRGGAYVNELFNENQNIRPAARKRRCV